MYELIAGILLTLLLLTLEHVLLWQQKLWLPIRYAIGVASLNAGITLAAGLAGHWDTVVLVWSVAVAGGLLVGGLHAWRHLRGERPADIDDAFAAGQLVARATREDSHAATRERPDRRN